MAGKPIEFPRGRELVLGVSAGIAAYKSCELLRRLQDAGFLVTVIPTASSLNFVGKSTWEALSGRPVNTTVWENASDVSHVSIADRADIVVVAPATADLIARIAHGRADDLLATTILATSAPILIVPAMHPNMWLNPATQKNVETLRSRGISVMDPDVGRLTGKDSGIGRFPETSAILSQVQRIAQIENSLSNRRVLVTAGGTLEAIDPVRFIGNRSSGRQGLAIAFEALRSGAEVTIVAGSTDFFELPGAKVINVESAEEMYLAVMDELPNHDALVMAAAVADAKPIDFNSEKIKKDDLGTIALAKNVDILKEASSIKRQNQVIVGFAAETSDDFLELAKEKLQRKGADLLYVNNVSGGAVFGQDQTSGYLLSADKEPVAFVECDKFVVAKRIINEVALRLESKNG